MVRRSLLLTLVAATMAFAGGAAVPGGAAFAYQCKNYPHQAVGIRKLKGVASVQSRKNWSATAKAKFGMAWSVWPLAKGKSVSCVKLNDGRWRCLASAKPCLYVVP